MVMVAELAIPSAPPPPASRTRATTPRRSVEALRLDVSCLLPRVDDEVRAMRTDADARRILGLHCNAARLDADARALRDAADELRWLASLAP